jgi:hypothetical protein
VIGMIGESLGTVGSLLGGVVGAQTKWEDLAQYQPRTATEAKILGELQAKAIRERVGDDPVARAQALLESLMQPTLVYDPHKIDPEAMRQCAKPAASIPVSLHAGERLANVYAQHQPREVDYARFLNGAERMCGACSGTGRVRYGHYTSEPSENERNCALCNPPY